MTLPSLSILGVGAVTPRGRVRAKIEDRGWKIEDSAAGSARDLQSSILDPRSSRPEPLRVDNTILALDPSLGAQMRRADRFTKMAVAAATDAWRSAGVAGVAPERAGLFFASGFGPHCRGFKFLDGILEMGDMAASPTDFSHSVHGAASAYISQLLDLRGPQLNSTDFEIGFEESIRLAQCWLNEGACDRVLLGAAEELGEVYLSCAKRILGDQAGIVPGEGAVFLLLARGDVPGFARIDATVQPSNVDLLVIEAPVVLPSQKVAAKISARQTISCTSRFGHSASASAFNLLGALLAMQEDGSIDTAALLRQSSEGRLVSLLLEKQHA
jgi:hypothetical protein